MPVDKSRNKSDRKKTPAKREKRTKASSAAYGGGIASEELARATRRSPHMPPAAWQKLFKSRATDARKRKVSVPPDGQPLLQGIRQTVALLRGERGTAIAAPLAKKGLDGAFLEAGELLTADYEQASATPSETSGREVLTPRERELRDEGARRFRAIRDSVGEVASTEGKEPEVVALGRSQHFTLDSMTGVKAALGVLLDGAKTRGDLLEEAGVDAEELAEIRRLRKEISAAVGKKGVRVNQRRARQREIERAILAMEFWMKIYRARARIALQDDEAGFALAVSCFPRRTDRRGRGGGGGGPGGGAPPAGGGGSPETK